MKNGWTHFTIYGFIRNIIQRKIERKRSRKRPRIRQIKDKAAIMSYKEVKKIAMQKREMKKATLHRQKLSS